MERIYLNNDWKYTNNFSEEIMKEACNVTDLVTVRIPHTCKEIGYNYCEEESYQMIAGYRNEVVIPKDYEENQIFLTFEGVAHEATVYWNGKEMIKHQCGYTAFTCNVTDEVQFGEKNVLAVRVDTRETLNQPPFGHVVDYMTFGGIYRDVYLEIKNPTHIEDVFVRTPEVLERKMLEAEITISQVPDNAQVQLHLRKWPDGTCKRLEKIPLTQTKCEMSVEVEDAALWSIQEPNLYELIAQVYVEDKLVDEKSTRFGFRTVTFNKEGCFLNGEKIKILGLNRHQSYPYVGYAMPKSMQELDADILKYELCVNAVRTSHYPQSKYFIDRCDEIGLLVFTEIPGWQHIGDEAWKDIAIQNTKEMVLQYRNHPSIMLWGVRINESQDDHEFYQKTNEVARALDPTRKTAGVRFIRKSELFEDVYTYNDFTHDGTNEAITKKSLVTTDMEKGYLISEFNGHMYPTKAFDDESHRLEHALRHARVLDAAMGDEKIAGAFGWCMFDYNTHKDFGSGDRICYHGVLDAFRNPKEAAAIYQIQGEQTPILEVSSSMDIGEYPGGVLGNVYLYTNADSVKMYRNDEFIAEFYGLNTPFKHLTHGPLVVDDFVGNRLVEQEGYSPKMAGQMKKLLFAAMTHGLNHLPMKAKLIAARLMLFHGMKVEDGVRLYNKYVSGWGESQKVYRFEAIKDGNIVKTVKKEAKAKPHLEIQTSKSTLVEETTYDVALIRITARDDDRNLLPYYQEPVRLHCEGEIELIGPEVISLKGGMGGTFVKTIGNKGEGRLILTDQEGREYKIDYQVEIA